MEESDESLTVFDGLGALLGVESQVESDLLTYGPLELQVASKQGKANTLLADHFFSPSLFFAEHIERGLVNLEGQTVLELGAGAALPSLLASTLPKAPKLVTITDHPDPTIFSNVQANFERNHSALNPLCRLACLPYAWGEPVDHLLEPLSPYNQNQAPVSGYSTLILSDLLYFDSFHSHLIKSISLLLSRDPTSKAYVGAGKYTAEHVCTSFFQLAQLAGLDVDEEGEVDDGWKGKMQVKPLNVEELAARKGNVRWWTVRWSSASLET